MDIGETSTTLPEVLVEKILAMVPFPNILKARALSKSWLARLSAVSSHDGDEEKCLAVSFQKIVGEYSSKWMTFCPVFVRMEDLIAYDESSQHWRSIPTLSFLPKDSIIKPRYTTQQIQGALSLIFSHVDHVGMSVANVLTQSWKLLPPHPQHDDISWLGTKLVSDNETYKVIMLGFGLDYYLVQIYDSQLDCWSNKRFDVSEDFDVRSNVQYLDGVVYAVEWSIEMAPCLQAFNVAEGTLNLLQMGLIDIEVDDLVDLVVCNGSLLMVIYDIGRDDIRPEIVLNVTLMKADMGSQRWLKLSQGPPLDLKFGNLSRRPSSNGNCIYLLAKGLNKVLIYNVQKDEWNSVLIPAMVRHQYNRYNVEYQTDAESFQPGLNPFVAV